MDKVMTMLLGTSWRTSLMGLVGGFFYYFSQAGVVIPSNWDEAKKALVAAGIFAWGRMQKDAKVTGTPDEAKKV